MKNLRLLDPILAMAAGTLSDLPDGHPMLERFDDLMAGDVPSDTKYLFSRDRIEWGKGKGFCIYDPDAGSLPKWGYHAGAAQVLASPATDLRIPKRKKNVNRPRRAGRKEG